MTGTEIREVDPYDDALLARWHQVERTSVRAGDPVAAHRSLTALASSVQHPSPYGRRVLLAAHRADDGDDRLVGVAELSWSLAEDPDLCTAEIHVPPDHRRGGVGRALWAEVDRRRRELGRVVVEGELDVPVAVPAAGPGEPAPGLGFAEAMGFRVVHTEDRQVLGLPVAADHLARLAQVAATAGSGYEVVRWRDRCPDDLADAYCAMRTRMNADVPTGESARDAVVMTVERLRVSEERVGRSYDTLVSAARRTGDGELAGYSLVFLPRDDDTVVQDDTFVMAGHRGRRLGTLLKLANLEVIAELDPPRRVVHTWTAPTNQPMLAVNRALGFVVASRSHEVQRRDG